MDDASNLPDGNDAGSHGGSIGGMSVEGFGTSGDGGSDVKYNKDGSIAKKRGRKPGTTSNGNGSASSGSGASGNSKKAASFDLRGIESLLLSIHAMGAVAFRSPEIMLTPEEGKALASAIADVSKYYPHHIDEKTIAWGNLVIVLIGLYGTRGVAIWGRLKAEKSTVQPAMGMPKQPEGMGNVQPMNPGEGKLAPFVVPGR